MNLAPDTLRGLVVIEWAVRGRPIGDEAVSGDLHVAELFDDGALVGAIDGLGHGPDAAHASRVAAGILGRDPVQPVQDLVQACHEALRGTRGAVMSLASIDAVRNRLCWVGVGNVDATLLRLDTGGPQVRDHIVPRNGVVGYQLPPLRVATTAIAPGDILIFASDGLRHGFAHESFHGHTLDSYADALLQRYGKTSDDALVLVVRYLGVRAPL
jgi:negative regulator of sigma-B (phosphoserine phosphatase)